MTLTVMMTWSALLVREIKFNLLLCVCSGDVDRKLKVVCYNNYNRELIDRFQNLKALYNVKKNIHCTNTHNYTSVQNKKINIFVQNMAKTHAHKIACVRKHAHTHTHTQRFPHKGSHTHNANKKCTHTNTHMAEKT